MICLLFSKRAQFPACHGVLEKKNDIGKKESQVCVGG